ncbi:uncharacterized protein PV07_03065 [Cladophialophora immunda]|uniref:Uncharacterized protein n=1 Tax=Cladophialophora immunda TaxID=569365 RepID=A0A0D2D6U0_9EURO|nr:uncharacterized protein PV07_03065 [Cladophialophora immunda]KIW31414.1 hypothetical protein PV07_03065 [Cladophialophora immunda]
MFFLSSPPPQPSPFLATTSQQSRRPSFSKSHNHDNIHGRAYARAYYAPHSPSPLRTTRNANLMPSPPQVKGDYSNSLLSSSPLRGGFSEPQDENENEEGIEISNAFGFPTNAQKTPAGKMNLGAHGLDGQSSMVTPPDSGSNHSFNSKALLHDHSTFKTSPSISTFADPAKSTISTTSSRQNPSQWELRSRSSSPSSLLTSQTHRNREQRKSKFLDRIRRRRDDDRSEQVGEQVLRMDFVKERRGWEREMARRAAMEAAQQEDMESDDDDDEELSPTQEYEEDIEVDELVREYEREKLQAVRDEEFVVEDDEDEEYERLFREMEILSQHSQPQQQSQPASQPQPQEYELAHGQPSPYTRQSACSREPPSQQPQCQHGETINDETMDLS